MKNPSVLNDLRPLIRKWLALRYETKSGARAILKSSLMTPPLEEWVRRITLRGTNGSTELWKWRSVPACAEWNSSKEKVLEKAVAGKLPEAEWANQVVTAAGLSRNSGDCRRNIDLVHRTGAGEFRFIELKIGSNNPVYAAIELLEYALLYWWSRQHPGFHKEGREDIELLSAKFIAMEVLAPKKYYEGFDAVLLRNFAAILANSYNKMTACKLNVEFRFGVLVLPDQPPAWDRKVLEAGLISPQQL